MTRAMVSADGDTITRPHSGYFPQARRSEAGGDAGWRRVGAAPARRQRHGQGAGAGVPVAENAGHGVHTTLEDLARAIRLPPSYVSHILRLTLLAPEIVEATVEAIP